MVREPLKFRPAKQIAKLVKKYSHGLSLDAGCGTGAYLESFNDDVVAMDVTKTFIKRLDKTHRVVGDVRFLPFKNNSFNFILCSEVVEYIKEEEYTNCISGLEKVIDDDGVLIVTNQNVSRSFFRRVLIKIFSRKIGPLNWNATSEKKYFEPGFYYNKWTKDTFKKYGFRIYGCLSQGFEKKLRVGLFVDILNFFISWFPTLLGAVLIGIKVVKK